MSGCQTHLQSLQKFGCKVFRLIDNYDMKLYLSISKDRGTQDKDDAWRICQSLVWHCCIVTDVTVWRWPRGRPRRHHHRWDAWMVRRRGAEGGLKGADVA